MRIRQKRHTGFSLLELVSVLAVALVLTLVAVNSYSAMKQRRSLRSGAEMVRDAFTNARSLAVSRNAWHRVVLQLRDPNTSEEKMGFWIDEIDPGTSTNPNPATLDTATRALVVPWQSLPEGVEFIDSNVRGTTITVASANPYMVVRFMPNGSSDDANIRLTEPSQALPGGALVSEIHLFSSTGKASIVAEKP